MTSLTERIEECPRCNGTGEVLTMTPNMRSRFIGSDDLSPLDFGETCGLCEGSGVVDCDEEPIKQR